MDHAREKFSVAEAGLVAEEREREEGKHAIFFSNSNAGEAEAFIGVKKPRGVNYQIHWKFDFKMQSIELICPRRKNEFWQT